MDRKDVLSRVQPGVREQGEPSRGSPTTQRESESTFLNEAHQRLRAPNLTLLAIASDNIDLLVRGNPHLADAMSGGKHLASFKPRIVGLPFSAPAYDGLTKPVERPAQSVQGGVDVASPTHDQAAVMSPGSQANAQ